MLNKKRSTGQARLKFLFAVPIIGGMLCASTMAFSKDYATIDLYPKKFTSVNVAQQDTTKKKVILKGKILPPPVIRPDKSQTPPPPPVPPKAGSKHKAKQNHKKFPPPVIKPDIIIESVVVPDEKKVILKGKKLPPPVVEELGVTPPPPPVPPKADLKDNAKQNQLNLSDGTVIKLIPASTKEKKKTADELNRKIAISINEDINRAKKASIKQKEAND